MTSCVCRMTTTTTHSGTDRIATRHRMVIGGQSVEGVDGRHIDIENPANRTTIGEVPRAGETDVDAAVRSAATAFDTWRQVAPRDRGRLLSKIADTVEGELESLARVVALETGNAI